MILLVLKIIVVAYVLGSFPSGVLTTRHTGKDITQTGSGNTGTANTFRIFGWRLALIVFVLDVAKGLLPIFIAKYFEVPPVYFPVIGFFAIIGHCFSIFLKFKFRGKGGATGLGVLLGINFLIGLIMLLIWIGVLVWLRLSSVATLSSAIILVFLGLGFRVELFNEIFFVVIAISIFLTHRKNIIRLFNEGEPDFFDPEKRISWRVC
jgi:glycerol-3-phosphate acyltransferase PlsY